MRLEPDEIYERLVKLGDAWADAHEAAELLEETKKTVLAQLAAECDEGSMSAKESYAMRHPTYLKHLQGMVVSRKIANRAKVNYDAARVWADLMRTKAANERVTLREAP